MLTWEGCPYATCDSSDCFSAGECLYKQESTMDEFHYIAVAGNQNTSGQCKTVEEAQKWAANWLGSKANHGKVYIYIVHSVVERDAPPIKIREIHQYRMNSQT